MKKVNFLLMGVASLLMFSCSSSKLAKETEKNLKGNWVLTTAESETPRVIDIIEIFNHSSKDCFEGSQWRMIPNNGTGNYVLEGAGCDTTPQQIKWYTTEENGNVYLWFKQIGEGQKAKNVTTGYKLLVESFDGSDLRLKHEVPFEGSKTTVYFDFTRLN